MTKYVARVLVALFVSISFLASAESLLAQDAPAKPTTKIIVVTGAPGAEEYAPQFATWAANWKAAAEEAKAEFILIGQDSAGENSKTDFDQLKEAVTSMVDDKNDAWLVLLGHGTYDNKSAKFNLRGPDVSAAQLNDWLKGRDAKTIVINCASSSSPFINKLARKNRIVVTATQSGFQYNFARFGGYLSESINAPNFDLDKDEQISLLEAFLAASRMTQEFYDSEGRLSTEGAILDDNGDGRATPAEWFQGTRVVKKSKDGTQADGLIASQTILVARGATLNMTPAQIAKRDQLEAKLEGLRSQKGELPESQYYQTLEPILIELATLYAESESSD